MSENNDCIYNECEPLLEKKIGDEIILENCLIECVYIDLRKRVCVELSRKAMFVDQFDVPNMWKEVFRISFSPFGFKRTKMAKEIKGKYNTEVLLMIPAWIPASKIRGIVSEYEYDNKHYVELYDPVEI